MFSLSLSLFHRGQQHWCLLKKSPQHLHFYKNYEGTSSAPGSMDIWTAGRKTLPRDGPPSGYSEYRLALLDKVRMLRSTRQEARAGDRCRCCCFCCRCCCCWAKKHANRGFFSVLCCAKLRRRRCCPLAGKLQAGIVSETIRHRKSPVVAFVAFFLRENYSQTTGPDDRESWQ